MNKPTGYIHKLGRNAKSNAVLNKRREITTERRVKYYESTGGYEFFEPDYEAQEEKLSLLDPEDWIYH